MRHLVLLACVAACAFAAPAAAWTVEANPGVTTGDQHIEYPAFGAPDRFAPQIKATNVGDVDGDGREDVAAAFDYAEPGGVTPIWVTFSSASASAGPVAELPGFKIVAHGPTFGMSAAGDVNGDGRGDIAIARLGDVAVVFGRGGGTVDLDDLDDDGFTILHAGTMAGGASGGWHSNGGVVALGDLDGDGVPELLVSSVAGARVVYLPHAAAGSTIDADARVGTIRVDGADGLVASAVDLLGDVDGDGRVDVLVAAAAGTDQVAYGVSAPAPGETITLPAAVGAGRAFSIRTHDGAQEGLEQATTLGDQTGDGIRDVGLVCGGCAGTRQLRVVFTPRFGSAVDAGDLYASDPRGWSFHAYAGVVDAGDQNGDGVADVGNGAYVYFPDPRHEPGTRESVNSGFYFSSHDAYPNAADLDVTASLADMNGDGRRELAVSSTRRKDDAAGGESATYALDVYDSATLPGIAQPDVPVVAPGGGLEVGVAVDPGAGSRGDRSLVMHPTLEIAAPGGTPQVVADPGVVRGRQQLRLGVQASRVLGGLVAGRTYAVRAAASNSRGQQAIGPWRSFAYVPPGAKASTPSTRPLRLSVGTTRLVLRDGRLAVRVTCGAGSGRCRGTLALKAGKLRFGSRTFSIADGRKATVRVAVSKAARRTLRKRRSVRVTATAKATDGAGLSGSATARFTARLR